MSATFNGLFILFIRIMMIALTYQVVVKIHWQKLFTKNNYYMAQYLCILISIGLGHMVGSFFVEVIQLMQAILLAQLI